VETEIILLTTKLATPRKLFSNNKTSGNMRKRHVAEVAEMAETSPPFRHKRHFRHAE
jgi:hypothetical protein